MIRAAALALGLALLAPRIAAAHPLHSTITEIVEDRAHGIVRATIRVFADDFATAVKRQSHGKADPANVATWDTATLAYATSAFSLVDRAGHPLVLKSCGVKKTSDLLWICLEASAPDAGSLRVRDAFLCDLFDDQVNVVQATINSARRSLLFTKGDAAKPLT